MSGFARPRSAHRTSQRDTGANTCRGLRPTCTHAACSESDVISRPWHSMLAGGVDGTTKLQDGNGAYMPMPVRPAVDFRYGAEQTRAACGEGYFSCHGVSAMCREDAKTWEPMDTTVMRKAWINITAKLCPNLGIHPYAPQCAGAMLATWAALARHSPIVPNTTLAMELRDSGATEGAAVGWTNPADAQAAVVALTHRAHEIISADHRDVAAAARGASSSRASLSAKVSVAPSRVKEVVHREVDDEVENVKRMIAAGEDVLAPSKKWGRRA